MDEGSGSANSKLVAIAVGGIAASVIVGAIFYSLASRRKKNDGKSNYLVIFFTSIVLDFFSMHVEIIVYSLVLNYVILIEHFVFK